MVILVNFIRGGGWNLVCFDLTLVLVVRLSDNRIELLMHLRLKPFPRDTNKPRVLLVLISYVTSS